MADNIFNLDNRVIDQDARHQRHCKKGNRVQRKAHDIYDREGRNDRQRQGDPGNDCGAPVSQEKKNHENSQDRAFIKRGHAIAIIALRVRHRRVNKLHFEAWIVGLQRLDGIRDLLGHIDIAGATRALDCYGDDPASAKPCKGIRLSMPIRHIGNLIETHQPSAR